MTERSEIFKIRVNAGPIQEISVETGIYRNAAAAVPALLGLELPIDVEIWCERLIPKYGPYHYRIRENEFGGIVVEHLVPRRHAAAEPVPDRKDG